MARAARRAVDRHGVGPKALAQDQLSSLHDLGTGVRLATHDGDSSREQREWTRDHGEYVLTNPDMLHRSLLPGHERWTGFWRSLSLVVVDECHHYRGVFGAHVAHVLRRLRRVCASYAAEPTFVLASATVADPAAAAHRLTGLDVLAVDEDASPRGRVTVGLWEPPLTEHLGENDAPVRRAASSETADLLTDLVVEGVRSLAFIRSRRGAEQVAMTSAGLLEEVDPSLAGRVAAYRGGYLPEERREIEQRLRSGELLGLAATNALELGIDVSGLDAVLVAGFPGTRAAFWQQVGRAGRGAQDAAALLVARDDPLDTYLVHHPESLFGRPVEATVFDPANPYVLGPHLAAAAQERPLTRADLAAYWPGAEPLVDDLVARGLLRKRPHGWFWTDRSRAADLADIRSSGGQQVQLVEAGTGRVVGTVDGGRAHGTAHPGAVYVHRGETYLVRELDLDDHVAVLERDDPDAVWWTIPPAELEASGLDPGDLPGAAHAAEHCSIGLLPLFATCDRWDIGGVSTALHPDTGTLTVFVHDGHPGGAGFAERGFHAAGAWLRATRETIASCECVEGCPSCIQSPKCGNQNNPLDKAGALVLLDLLLAHVPLD